LARYIAKKRTPPVAQRYGQIGRRSPIGILTERQRTKLVAAVSPYLDPVAVTAMRYWKPLTADAVAAIKKANRLDELVLLPPYPRHIQETVRLVCEGGAQKFPNWPRTHLLCFQSKVGPAKWLEPSFVGTLHKLGHEGVKEMLVVPISFVTEHIETLHEINIEGRADAKKAGIERFRMMPAVGDSPLF